MMYILRQSEVTAALAKFNNDPDQHNWHVGGMKPRAKDGTSFEDVCEVYADGHELEHIRSRCTNLPDVPTQGFMVWRAPFAQFVYDSLIYVHGGDETAHFREAL